MDGFDIFRVISLHNWNLCEELNSKTIMLKLECLTIRRSQFLFSAQATGWSNIILLLCFIIIRRLVLQCKWSLLLSGLNTSNFHIAPQGHICISGPRLQAGG